jgi:type III restriction enzyme
MDRGAHYARADLQVHTPRDRNWKPQCVGEDNRRQFSREFIAACRAAGLGAVAITDHHDFAFLPYIREAAKTEIGGDGAIVPEAGQLVVFPGLELTLEVPCQVLLIFSADFPGERLSTVLDKLDIDPADPAEPWGAEPQKLKFLTLGDLHDRLDQTDWLRGEYIVLPNVTDGGYKSLMRSGMDAQYRDMPCVGGYLDGPVENIGSGNARIFAGLDAVRGNKSIATLQTSDARSFDRLGANTTWIKWAEPTAEALRQACLARESRIAHTEPALPSVHVTAVVVSNSKFLGPVSLELNPQYNALIGGRGTGKSSFLEYLRWGLCDQPPEIDKGDDGPDLAGRRRRLIDLTLQPLNGHVEVHFKLNGIPHVVRRYPGGSDLRLKIGDQPMAAATEDEVRSLLPVQAYSQRQLSDVGVDIGELTRFVTAPIKDRLEELDGRRDEVAGAIRENFAHLQRVRALELAIARDRLSHESLGQQAVAVRETLGGLADEDQAIVRAKPGYDQGDALVKSWANRVKQATDEVQRASEALRKLADGATGTVDPELPDQQALTAVQHEIRELLTRADAALESALADLRAGAAPGSALDIQRAAWAERYSSFDEQYDQATGRSTAHSEKLEELEALEVRRGELQQSLDTHAQQLQLLGDPSSEHARMRTEWRSLQAERTTLLAEQCEALGDLSDQLISATIRPGAGTTAQQQRFKAELQGSGVRSAKIEAFLDAVAATADPLAEWHAALDELEAIVLADSDLTHVPSGSTALKTFASTDLARMAPKLTPEAILELSLLGLDDHPVFEYRVKEGEHIAFADASAGQQATALLRVLLNQGGPPLIIDQPEDDLDSQVIQEIVDLIWTAKSRRQLIFSSHNANLVVNGDAELVACFNYRTTGDHSSGHIELEGAIDIPAVRKEITTVMEGGEKAFRLRKEKYGF